MLGTHVRQAGSLVAPDRLRFDFTHIEATKPEELAAVQRLVNEKIRENLTVHTESKSYDEAIAGGATALFGEKYAARVRVVEVAEDREAFQHGALRRHALRATGEIGHSSSSARRASAPGCAASRR